MRLIDADKLNVDIALIAKERAKSDAQKALIGRIMFVVENYPTIDAVFCTNCGGLVNGGNEQMDREVKGLRITFKEPKEITTNRAQAVFYGAVLYTEYFIKDGFLMIVDDETLVAMYALDEISSVKLIYKDEPEFEPEFEGEVV